ncbi:MAG: YwqG family protein [Ruminococcus flavefaciens]|nr:YwqG family protein [Ruminococcus flavefaciens]
MPDLMEILKYKGAEGRRIAEELKKYYRNAIYITEKSYPDIIPIGASKMGGYPDLPPEIEYPTMSAHTQQWHNVPAEHYEKSAMQLVIQINLCELAESGADVENLLAKKGMLYIFWSGELFNISKDDIISNVSEPDKTKCFKVIYWDGDISVLKRTEPPCPYYSKYFDECFEEYAIDFVSSPEYSEESADEIENLEEITDTDVADFAEYGDKMLGFPKGANRPDIEDDEVLLFQNNYEMGCLWSEYWLINKKDMKNLDFSRVRFAYDID